MSLRPAMKGLTAAILAAVCLAGWALAGVACAEDASCGEPTFPEAAAFLETQGYPSDEYVVLLAWDENAPNKPGTFIKGYHLYSYTAQDWFDLYSGPEGNLLSMAEAVSFGIRPKIWDLPPLEQNTKLRKGVSAKAASPPAAVAEPVGPAEGLAASEAVGLAALDLGALLEEDFEGASTPNKAVRRIGVVRKIPESISVKGQSASVGDWVALDDGGWLWSTRIVSPEARAIRVRFATLSLPKGASVTVYNTLDPSEAYGPYTAFHANDSDLWAASCFSDDVTVECYVPEDADLTKVCFVIDKVVHTYADFATLQWTKAAGSCNQDVSCFPEWAGTASGVGAFAFITSKGQLHCTGTLIADTDDGGDIPYFLTANHCVSQQEGYYGSSNMEFFWLYQTSSCNGDAPALADVPRNSDGADFLAGSNSDATDFTLVRLRSAPPEDVAYVGWSTDTYEAGTEVVCIHHPSSDYKRISFGTLSDSGSPRLEGEPVQPYELYHEVLWNLGTTEHGSSGSPLLDPSGQRIMGQLWGGYASCSAVSEPDYFGRLDVTFPVIAYWLSPSVDPMDVDKSGDIDSADLQITINAALGAQVEYNADVDLSGNVDAVDVQLIVVAVLNAAS